MNIKDKTYLIPKKGSDGSDPRKSSFAVSPGSLEALTVPKNSYKALIDNNLDRKRTNKERNALVKYLKNNNAWKSFYDENGVFGDFFREGLEDFLNEYRQSSRLTQKQVSQGDIKLFIPEMVKNKGMKAVSEYRQNNQ